MRDAAILGGPTWIDFDHFDVVAKVTSLKPSSLTAEQASTQTFQNPYDQIRPVLKRVLAERFHLTYHKLTEVCTYADQGCAGERQKGNTEIPGFARNDGN